MVFFRRGIKRRRRFTRRIPLRKMRLYKRPSLSTVKSLISRSEESKWKQIEGNLVTQYSAPSINQVNAMTRGAARSERIGNRVTFKYLELIVTLVAAPNVAPPGGPGPSTFNRARLLVFWDRQPNGAAPSPGTIFSSNTTGLPYNTNTMLSPLNPDYFGKRYKIIIDRLLSVGVEGGSTNVGREKMYRFRKRLNTKAQFNDTNAGNVTDFIKNTMYIMVVSDEDGANNYPGSHFNAVLKWKDA